MRILDKLTLDNYKDLCSDCTEDVLDEIRLSILDDIDIRQYIFKCGDDSYKLGQIRLALRNRVPRHYILTQMTSKSLKYIRESLKCGKSVKPIERYIYGDSLTIDTDLFEQVVLCNYLGGNIDMVDFREVKSSISKIVCEGLVRGYPMWLLAYSDLSESYIRLLMRGMDLNIDITRFLDGGWGESQLMLLFVNSVSVDINEFLTYVTKDYSAGSVDVLLGLYRDGIEIDRLTYKDEFGSPLYNEYQIEVLASALRLQRNKGVDIDMLFNPRLCDYEMQSILNTL